MRASGSLLPLTAAKQKVILATLLLRAGEVVSTDELLEALWPQGPPANALTALQGYVLQLRRILEPDASKGNYRVLVTKSPGYALAIEARQLDVRRFEGLFHEGRELLAAGAATQAGERLREALGLWRGTPLADFRYESFAQPAVGRLEEQRLACLEERIDADLALGRHSELVGELEALVANHPLRERLAGQLMLALYRSGRQAEALDVYGRVRERLVDELGIDPGTDLQRLYKAILNQEEALAAPTPTETRADAIFKLPSPLTPLIGRDRELAEMVALIENRDIRLVTVTGPGGVGKTRLALAVADSVRTIFPDGIVWLSLQALRDPSLVVPAIAQELDATSDPETAISLRTLLLCLDNLEQLLVAGPDLARLLAACPNLRLLATSREPLHLSGEQRYPLGPLADEDSAALFAARARAVRPDFTSNGEVEAICRRLDHLPLAVELAAARVSTLTSEQILERLDHRLGLLTGGPRDAPARQTTLTATIEWSYDLLADAEKRQFARLSVFAGSFDLQAAETVCETDLDALTALVDKNLLTRSAEDEEDRFRMLETIRAYAVARFEQSGEQDEIEQRHTRFYEALAEPAEEAFFGAQTTDAARRLAREHDNLRAVLRRALDGGDGEAALRLANLLALFWKFSHLSEGVRWLDEALDSNAPRSTPLRAKAHLRAGALNHRRGDFRAARGHWMQSLEIARALRDNHAAASASANLGLLAVADGEYEDAAGRFEEAAEFFAEVGDDHRCATSLNNLAIVMLLRGEHDRARGVVERCLALCKTIGSEEETATVLHTEGFVRLAAGDQHRAHVALGELSDLALRVGDTALIAAAVEGIASIAVANAEWERAASLFAFAEAYRVANDIADPVTRRLSEPYLGRLDERLEPVALQRARNRGKAMTLDEVAAQALSLD